MNNFRTEIKLEPSSPITHQAKILTAGSCFADHLGGQLAENKFNTSVNPFGVSYNPIAIHESLLMALGQSVDDSLFIHREDTWKHFMFHSQWSDASRDFLKEKLQIQIRETAQFLSGTRVLILTYGTAWTYRHKETNRLVGNCHKVPSQHFDKFLLSPSQVIDSFKALYESLTGISPETRIILTVSPVRHTRDTLELNNVSKSALRIACHYITQQFRNAEYFPAYEIMMDDLRDYRFYESDMIHPSALARQYIFEQFAARYFEPSTIQLLEKIQFINKAMAHKPFHLTSPAHQKFLGDLLLKLEELNGRVDVSEEIRSVKSQLL